MKRKVMFNKSGSGSINAKIVIPQAYVELMCITEDDRTVDITFKDGNLIIRKVSD